MYSKCLSNLFDLVWKLYYWLLLRSLHQWVCWCVCETRQDKSEAVKIESKPTSIITAAHKQQLPNHQRQALEPKSIALPENKVNMDIVN